jgi:hypothetical protein
MSRFLLLTPLIPSMFAMETYDEITEALAEFGCSTLVSMDPLGNTVMFAVSNTQNAMTSMTATVELPGIVVEYTAVYDQAQTI